mgnify:CR=1 FL=1
MGLDNDIRTMAVRERMRVRYDRYTNNEAAQERLELAQVALDELPAYQAKIIKQEVRALTRKVKGLGQKEGLALVWAIGKLFKEQPAYYESQLSEYIIKHLEGGDEQ